MQARFDLQIFAGKTTYRTCLSPTREVRYKFLLDARDVRVEPLPEALGIDGEGEEVHQAHFTVPL